MEIRDDPYYGPKHITACTRHTPKKRMATVLVDEEDDAMKDEEANLILQRNKLKKKSGFGSSSTPKKKKFLEVYAHHMISLQKAEKHIKKVPSQSLPSVYEYWAQKRKSRSGNPLLKRLQKNVLFSPHSQLKSSIRSGAIGPEVCLKCMNSYKTCSHRLMISGAGS
jgi:hypothetical protein